MTTICCPGWPRVAIRVLILAVLSALAHAWVEDARSAGFDGRDLADLTLEQLSNIVVSSVSRRQEPLASAAASIYVINADDIRRSGATTLPEALRLAPNLQVARADANQYAISARGFNNVLANRLLVLIDGRIVYSPLFSGVFWEAQDVMLEDVERIEVISGPGSTLWGANAVNGVINIITHAASATQGALFAAGAGNRERGSAVRYGGAIGSGHFRIYGKHFDRDHTQRANRTTVLDGSARSQAGFRADWKLNGRDLTVQGDIYQSDIDQVAGGSRDIGGANVLARWSEERSDGTTLRAQAYYDRVEREQPGSIRDALDIFDVEFQHGIVPAAGHRLLWGAGYRYADDRLENLGPRLAFRPANRELAWYNVFGQHEWRLRSDLALTLGLKAEHNDYTGLEWLPSARLAWELAPDRLIWSALSRTVRAPSRIDRELFLPANPPFAVAGGPDFQAEVSDVLEIGYRAQPGPTLSYSVTGFYHDHSRLRSLEPRAGGARLENRISGSTRGVEAWGTWRALPRWRLEGGWVELRQRLAPDADSLGTLAAAGHGNDPKRWVKLRSAVDLSSRHELDVMLRYVGALPSPAVPSYTAVDARLGWRLARSVELSLLLQNLFDRSHPEFGLAANRVEFRRGAFVNLVWRP